MAVAADRKDTSSAMAEVRKVALASADAKCLSAKGRHSVSVRNAQSDVLEERDGLEQQDPDDAGRGEIETALHSAARPRWRVPTWRAARA
jgi:hypothetical protein